MLRRRLTFAFSALAFIVVLQGAAAVAVLGVAERELERGRVVSDIERGFVELSATKKALRAWVARLHQNAGADPAERDALQASLDRQVAELGRLAAAAQALDDSAAGRAEHLARIDALAVLGTSLVDLKRAVRETAPLAPGADARQAWEALSAVFDRSQGRDLRSLLAESIDRESAALARERRAADRSMALMRGLSLAAAASLALAAILAAWHFARALRDPLQRLGEGARTLEAGRLEHRLSEQGDAEFAAVARSMNTMAGALQAHQAREAEQRQQLELQVQARTAELQGALEALRRADAQRRQLFADVSHELRTPTTAIRGEAEVTLRGRDRPAAEYRESLQRIVEASRQLGEVIDDLLAMARSDIDALTVVRRPLDLAGPLAEAQAQAAALAAERGVLLQPAGPGAWPVLGDAQRLRQLLLVLLDNAVRYSRRGGEVRVTVRPPEPASAPSPGLLAIEVADEGIGIPAEDLPHVFERHFRGESARRHRADGIGLGLAIARTLAAAHGGTLELHSEPGRGTVARLTLPLHAHEALAA